MGQQAHQYKNLLNRQLQAAEVNTKWVTDFPTSIPSRMYLFMIRDRYGNRIVAYKTGTEQTVIWCSIQFILQ